MALNYYNTSASAGYNIYFMTDSKGNIKMIDSSKEKLIEEFDEYRYINNVLTLQENKNESRKL